MPSMMEAAPGVRPCAIADGYLVNANGLDGITYCYGKGKSQTTVSAPSTEVMVGQKFTITGTVLDMSPAQEGTAAVSDESMSDWMQYLHMQASKPTNATGVSVTLTAVDPNNNLISIGAVTSDTNGVYGLTWTPEVSGTYQVIATFTGSDSYGSSVSSTYFTAVDSPSVTAEPTLPPSITDSYFIPSVAAIIVAIIAVGAILAILTLKKRP
jgi:hypothetical protein